MTVDLGTLPRVDLGQFGAVGGRDRRADRTVALSYTDAVTQTACWEERPQVCDEIRLALAEARRRTPSAGLRGTPGGRRQGPSSVGPRQVLLLLLLLLPTCLPTDLPTCPPTHQDKNPEDGSRGMACPHTLPSSGP